MGICKIPEEGKKGEISILIGEGSFAKGTENVSGRSGKK